MTAKIEYVSSAKAAAYYGVTTQTLRKWAKLGKIDHFRLPSGHHRFLLAGMPAKAAPAPVKPAPRREPPLPIEQAIAKAPPPKPDPAALRRQIDALAT